MGESSSGSAAFVTVVSFISVTALSVSAGFVPSDSAELSLGVPSVCIDEESVEVSDVQPVNVNMAAIVKSHVVSLRFFMTSLRFTIFLTKIHYTYCKAKEPS